MQHLLKYTGIILGIIVFFMFFAIPAPESLGIVAWRVIACAALMLTWWITEAIPIPVTALLPIILFPLLGISDIKQAAAPYGSPMVFLFLGGFLLALAMERWNLHTRIALNIVKMAGTNANGIIGGFMVATATLSMWMSNTATTVMMLPIAISIVDLMAKDAVHSGNRVGYQRFFTALMIGIAYAASIGGMATLIGTPPNIIFSGFMQSQFGFDVSFAKWMMVGVPIAFTLLASTWVILTKICFRNGLGHLHGSREMIVKELAALGPMQLPEVMVLLTFTLTALLWILRSQLNDLPFFSSLSDEGIAVMGAILLFLLPANKQGKRVMNWKTTEKLPWGILLLFGGGLSLAAALENSGVIAWLGHSLSALQGVSIIWVVVAIVALVIFMTEFMSNMALTAVFLPIASVLALGFGENPLLLTLPSTLAASCAFMLPMATPPNAIVFGSGHVTIPQMIRAGFLLNIISVFIIVFIVFTLVPYIFGVHPGVIPSWAK